jgi:hypothetical protein
VPNSAIIVATNLTRGWARVSEDLQVPSDDPQYAKYRPGLEFHRTAIRIEEQAAGQGRVKFNLWLRIGYEVISPGDLESLQHCARGHTITKKHNVVHDRGIRSAFWIRQFRVGRRQRHVAERFETDTVVPAIEPDQRLPS